jgi:mannose-1-phosphate guanylyltransferase
LKSLCGVLFLTAGYGTRSEPLSIARPKALLPWKNTTLLGNLMEQTRSLGVADTAVNCSRCPELVADEAGKHSCGRLHILFEERPLGLPGTLARASGLIRGHWMICNTDMVLDLPLDELISHHFRSGSGWTALTGDFPPGGGYGGVNIQNHNRHYLGVSIVCGELAETASAQQIHSGYFTGLRKAALSRGIELNCFHTDAPWMDMGTVEHYRKNTLRQGCFVHSTARVEKGAVLRGFYTVGAYCIIESGAWLQDSVMLPGSVLCSGTEAKDEVLPWLAVRSSVD